MQIAELQAMTVLQLRKLAKENGVKLSAGIDKAGIVERVGAVVCAEADPKPTETAATEQPKASAEAPSEAKDASGAEPLQTSGLSADVTSIAPAATRQWSGAQPEGGYRPVYRQAWQARTAAVHENGQKPAWQRTANPPSRFGPQSRVQQPETEAAKPQPAPAAPVAPTAPVAPQRPAPEQTPRLDGYRLGYRAAPQRPAYPSRSEYDRRDNGGYGGYQNRSYQQGGNYGGYPNRGYQQQGNYRPNNYGGYQPRSYPPQQSAEQHYNDGLYRLNRDAHFAEQMENGQLPDLLQTAETEHAEGILEVLPDGYGFLRGKTLLPSRKDVYVSMAQIRRYGLRTGDRVGGKARVQRENDRYAALLLVETVNGGEAQENPDRPSFDELVPVYPNRRIVLEEPGADKLAVRLVDLIAPIGFGQRAMIVAPPDSGRLLMLRDLSCAIKRNDPEAEVLMLLIDIAPEEVTEISEAVDAEVFASTFADAPETQTRVSETMLERAQRLVEQGRNVVILLDSLNKLTRAYQAVLAQGGRPTATSVTPAALVRPKRFFGAARNTRDAGSLTVIATIAVETGSRVDDIIFEEFKGTANMELTLCTAQPNDPVHPMLNLQLSGTKKEDMLLTDEQKEGLRSIRRVLGSATNGEAVVQIVDMMQKTKCNADLLERLKEWLALWAKSGYLK